MYDSHNKHYKICLFKPLFPNRAELGTRLFSPTNKCLSAVLKKLMGAFNKASWFGQFTSEKKLFGWATNLSCRSQWLRGLRRRSSVASLLRLWFRIPPGAWMSVCCECCVLSGRGLCDGFITRPGESYRLWRVVVCDQETSKTRRLKPATGL